MQSPQADRAVSPITATATNHNNTAPRADRLTRSKIVYRAACDAWMLGDLNESQRLIELWHELQRPEVRRT